MAVSARAHVVLPGDLIVEIDKLAGKRKRSRFVEEAIRDKLRREKLRIALEKTVGILNPTDYPEWSTPERTSEWVRASRRADDERLARKLAGRGE